MILLQWIDLVKRTLRFDKTPILQKFLLVQVKPLKGMTQCPLQEVSVHHTRFDLNCDLVISIHRMKMWWRMIPIEHADHNPEESGYFRHRSKITQSGSYFNRHNVPMSGVR